MARRKVRVDGAINEPKTQALVAPHAWQMTASRATAQSVPEPHSLERLITHELRTVFSLPTLVVRRTRNGICLQGVLHWEDGAPDVTSTAQRIAGVEHVINHLVIVRESGEKQTRKLPK